MYLFYRMMQILKSRDTSVESEVDQGYSSARTSPNQTPSTSPSFHVERRPDGNYTVLDLEDSNTQSITQPYTLPTAVDMTLQRVNTATDYRYCRSRRLVDASLEVQPSTSVAVKRGIDSNVDIERKRYRLASQMSQVLL